MDTKIGSFAKVSPPAMTQIIHRTRLFSWLDSRSEQPICWVNGPAGCGKTTLVASYIDYRKLACLWYQIDAGDADPASFLLLSSAWPKTANDILTVAKRIWLQVPRMTYFQKSLKKFLKGPKVIEGARRIPFL